MISAEELAEMGFSVALYPSAAQKATIRILQQVYGEILAEGTSEGILDDIATWEERNEVTGLAEFEALEDQYARDE